MENLIWIITYESLVYLVTYMAINGCEQYNWLYNPRPLVLLKKHTKYSTRRSLNIIFLMIMVEGIWC
jgi:hypothetical protein